MLLLPQKQKIASMIIGRGKPDFVQKLGEEASSERPSETPEGPESDASAALEAAASKMISAFKTEDPKTIVSVIKDMFSILANDDDGADELENG